MPIDINDLCEGWLELESDPGLFTLLLEDLGACGVQVEEIYDLQKPVDGPVLGFIFLFRWTEERRSRRKTNTDCEQFIRDEKTVNTMFFAHQVVPNSCATHALLSVLLNCPQVTLGPTLSRLKSDTAGMSPDNKGLAIGNTPELARAHNSHAVPQPPRTACDRNERNSIGASGRYSAEAFHFVSYVPINGRLYELDGLKPYPIDHGQWASTEDWTELFRRVILDRIGSATSGGEPCHDIRFSLMVVVPDKRLALSQRLRLLKTNKKIVVEALQQLMSSTKLKTSEVKSVNESLNIDVDSGEVISFRAPVTTALTIQTSPVPSTSSYSTDTASESGSAFNSPTDVNHHATTDLSSSAYVKDFSRLVVVKMGCQKQERLETCCEDEPKTENGLLLPAPGSPKQEMNANAPTTPAPTCTSSPTLVRTPTPTITTTTSSTATPSVSIPGPTSTTTPSPTPATTSTSLTAPPTSSISSSTSSSSTCNTLTTTTGVDDSESMATGVNDPEPQELIPTRDDSQTPSQLQQQRFGTRDLIALLKSLEKEIDTTEGLLLEEVEKRKKYRIDDSRRTHNYDEFICTFLSMLAEQGTLASLVEQHTTGRKRLHRGSNSVASNRHKRGRPRYKRRR